MRRVITFLFCIVILTVPAVTQTGAAQRQPAETPADQSLADKVRQLPQKQGTPATPRSFTNDNLPHDAVVNVSGAASSSQAEEAPSSTKTKDGKEQSAAERTASEQKKVSADWSAKLDDQKKQVADLEHEVDLMQREHQLRVAELYWDAGNRLRDDKKWTEDEQKYQDSLADKNSKLQAARGKLDQLKEEARKAGVPGRTLE